MPTQIRGIDNYTTEYGQMMQLMTAQTASGTSVDFTDIPSWAKRITVMLYGVSTSGTSNILIQLGTSSGIETTGYLGSAVYSLSSSVAATSTAGILVTATTVAASVHNGGIIISAMSGTLFSSHGITGFSNTAAATVSGYSKSISGTLDRIRITTVNGTDTFDAGTINILVEGY